MLGMFLGILKIIGIVLLVILLIILALLLIVLFVPVRYRAHATIDHTDLSDEDLDIKERIRADASFTWLLHLLRGGIGYPDNMEFYLKVLFFKILPKSEEAKRKKEEKQRKKDLKKSNKKLEQALENAGDAQEIGPEDRDGKDSGDSSLDSAQDTKNPDGSGNLADGDNAAGESSASDKEGSESDTGKGQNGETKEQSCEKEDKSSKAQAKSGDMQGLKSDDQSENDKMQKSSLDSEPDDGVDIFTFFDFLEKLTDLFWGTIDFIEKPEKAVEKAFYTISKACDKIDLIRDTLESPTFERAYRCAKKDLFLILKHVMPKKITADILLGLGDPATTAQVLAGVNIVNVFHDYDIYLEPDIDNKVVEATVDIRGRIALWRLVLSAARVYFNKDIRKVWKRINRIINK